MAIAALALVLAGSGWAGLAHSAEPTSAKRYAYVSPLPASRAVSRWNNIALRPGGVLDSRSIRATSVSVVGSLSGMHAGTCRLSDDSRTLVFVPAQPYALGETVSVKLASGPRLLDGEALPPLEYEFFVAARDPQLLPTLESFEPEPLRRASPRATVESSSPPFSALDRPDLPTGYPGITFTATNNPDPGCVFVTPRGSTDVSPLLIIDNLGMPIFFRRLSTDLVDLKKNSNGQLTYYDSGHYGWYALDSLYAVVDSFFAGNGYLADHHDFQLLPNGHALVIIYDTQAVGMDTVVAGGNPDALVFGFVVQELDASKNVIFQWRSWDHFQITDCVTEDLTAPTIDYVHGNAVELDTDGNLMISCRNMNEITKIDRQTGDIIWRWGLNSAHNEFTFVGDTRGFGHQHDIRRTYDGHITVFDNGWVLNPPYARSLEYQMDEQNKVVTLVRAYLPDGGGASHSNGSMQKRVGGGTMVNWGAGSVIPDVTDYHADGSKALEFSFDPLGMNTYMAYRFEWKGALITTDTDDLDFGYAAAESLIMLPLTIRNNGPINLTITSIVNKNPTAFGVLAATPIVIPHGQSVVVWIQFHPHVLGPASGTIYIRSGTANQFYARSIQVRGIATDLLAAPRGPATRRLSLAQSQPNPALHGLTIPFSIARPGAVTLRVYDLSGRVVATLLDASLQAGEHVARWDGTGGDGRALSPGAYCYELRSGGERVQRRLVLLR